MRIILASQSPRRRQLLGQIGVEYFEILVPEADESYDPALPPEEIVASICRKKAKAAGALADDPGALIIAADTMVFLGGLRLGKPRDQVDAYTMLSALSGRTHHVCTGVTVCQGGRMETRPETTDVIFRPLTEADGEALEKDMVVMDGREVWYNGRDTLRRKVALAKEKGLGGVMVWEISEDCGDREKSLLTVLGRAIAEGGD